MSLDLGPCLLGHRSILFGHRSIISKDISCNFYNMDLATFDIIKNGQMGIKDTGLEIYLPCKLHPFIEFYITAILCCICEENAMQ